MSSQTPWMFLDHTSFRRPDASLLNSLSWRSFIYIIWPSDVRMHFSLALLGAPKTPDVFFLFFFTKNTITSPMFCVQLSRSSNSPSHADFVILELAAYKHQSKYLTLHDHRNTTLIDVLILLGANNS